MVADTRVSLEESSLRPPRTNLGEILRELRLARGLSQLELSGFAGHSESLIEKVENGKRGLSERMIADICGALEIADLDPRMDSLLIAAAHFSIASEQAKGTEIRFIPVDPETTLRHKKIIDSPMPLRFKFLQLRGDLTTADLASTTGISTSEINKIEAGIRVPSRVTVAKICCVLGIPLNDPMLDNLLLEASYRKINEARKKRHSRPLNQPLRP